ncbi:MAG: glycosyltransferase [Armatimonadetes bacterium]|nr:glycosyltransferase [Armatimonadota bacterium]
MPAKTDISAPLKVLAVTNMYPTDSKPYCGISVQGHVEALRAAGIEVDVLFIDGPASKLNYLWGIFRLWACLLRKRYDVIHAHYVYIGWVARMQIGTPVVVTSHGSDTLGDE